MVISDTILFVEGKPYAYSVLLKNGRLHFQPSVSAGNFRPPTIIAAKRKGVWEISHLLTDYSLYEQVMDEIETIKMS